MDVDLNSYNSSKWIQYENHWLYNAEQRTEDWLLVKRGRPSGSTIGACLGQSRFTTSDLQAEYLCGTKTKEFTEQQQKNMNYGTEMEPIARRWYENSRNVVVEESGMIVPKWNLYLGVSVDGLVKDTNGIIEIKCVKKMYYKLKQRLANKQKNTNNYDHIFASHYLQMQLGMAVWNRTWCDYIVYCPNEKSVYVETIPFDSDRWKNEWYPQICNFIDQKIKPLLKQTPFPLLPPITTS
jgi:putative phage-type endonuclease